MRKKTREKISCVYVILQVSTLRCYIGSTYDKIVRWHRHRFDLKWNKHSSKFLQRCWNKYGEQDFVFLKLEACREKRLIHKEQYWIDELKPEFNSAPAAGSTRGYSHTIGAKQKMSIAHTGHVHSAEHKKKISEANRGRILSDEHCFRIGLAVKRRRKLESKRRDCASSSGDSDGGS